MNSENGSEHIEQQEKEVLQELEEKSESKQTFKEYLKAIFYKNKILWHNICRILVSITILEGLLILVFLPVARAHENKLYLLFSLLILAAIIGFAIGLEYLFFYFKHSKKSKTN